MDVVILIWYRLFILTWCVSKSDTGKWHSLSGDNLDEGQWAQTETQAILSEDKETLNCEADRVLA